MPENSECRDDGFLHFKIVKFRQSGNIVPLSNVRVEVCLRDFNEDGKVSVEKKIFPKYDESKKCICFDAHVRNRRLLRLRMMIDKDYAGSWSSDLAKVLEILETDTKQSKSTIQDFNLNKGGQFTLNIRFVQARHEDPRVAEKRFNELYVKNHVLVPKIFTTVALCLHCKKFLWGFTLKGYECTKCGGGFHKKCIHRNSLLRCLRPSSRLHGMSNDADRSHDFIPCSFQMPSFCAVDGRLIRGARLQGLRCKNCGTQVHRRCVDLVSKTCGMSKQQTKELLTERERAYYDVNDEYGYQCSLIENIFEKKYDLPENRRIKICSLMSIDHFDLICILGKGAYGKVYYAKFKSGPMKGQEYAIKIMSKYNILYKQDESYIMSERYVMEELQGHQFFTCLFYSFQTDAHLFIVMDYVSGGNLYALIGTKGVLADKQIILYTAEIAIALKYMHSKNIAYRDLKPENVLIHENGHIKLTDFSLSKTLDNIYQRMFTFCGTLEYIAPEIYMRPRSYNYMVDWWALGVLVYEMILGYTPFEGENEIDIENLIVESDLNFRDLNENSQMIIKALLERDPSKRLNDSSIFKQPFFENFSEQDFYNQRYPVVWKPQARKLRMKDKPVRMTDMRASEQRMLISAETNCFDGFSYCKPVEVNEVAF